MPVFWISTKKQDSLPIVHCPTFNFHAICPQRPTFVFRTARQYRQRTMGGRFEYSEFVTSNKNGGSVEVSHTKRKRLPDEMACPVSFG